MSWTVHECDRSGSAKGIDDILQAELASATSESQIEIVNDPVASMNGMMEAH